MRKLVYVSGAVCAIMILIGMLFILMQWQFDPITSGLLLTLGIVGLSFIFIPSFAMCHYKKRLKIGAFLALEQNILQSKFIFLF